MMVKTYAELPKKQELNDNGTLKLTHNFLNAFEGCNPKARLFSIAEVEPGQAVPFHVHNGENETYYFLSGVGLYNDNGTEVPVAAGMTTFCPAGEGHGVVNTGTAPLRFVALILAY